MLLISFEGFVLMSETISTTVCYGELRASKGNALIQYDEAIVAPKLFPLDAQQKKSPRRGLKHLGKNH